MFKKVILTSIMILSVLFTHCSDQSSSPIVSDNNNNSVQRLSKRVWNTSQEYNWPKHSVEGFDHHTYFHSDLEFDLSFDNYSFSLVWSGCSLNGDYTYGSVSVYVNSQYCTTVNWNDPKYNPSAGYVGWTSFSYNNIQMSVNINKGQAPNDGDGDILAFYTQPEKAQIKVEDLLAPDTPTGFSVSPVTHNNLNQAVTLSWNASSDTDVTGYQIFRQLEGESQFTSIADISPRTTTQWIDSNVPWNSVTMTVATYKIRAVDNTHSLFSDYTSTHSSALP